MATYYVDGTSGIDTNTGLSQPQSLKTCNALPSLASGDKVFLAGQLRNNDALFTGAATAGPGLLATSGLSNVIITAMPGGSSTPEFRGDTQLVQTGWTADTNAWKLTLTGAAATAPDAVVYKWDASTDSNGHHYGHLVPDTLANVQGATGSIGRYNYNTGTKVMTVYLGGDNPNASGYPVGVCWVPTSQEAVVKISGGSGNSVNGINFALYPSQGATGQTGWAVILMSSPNSTVAYCTCKDMGAHGNGSYASGSSSSGCYIVGCTTHSGRAGGGGAYIHFTTSAFTLAARNVNCRADLFQLLGTDGAARADGSSALDAFSGNGFYAHSDSGTPVQDILSTGCIVQYYQDPGPNFQAFNAGFTPTVSDGTLWSSYSNRCDQCQIINSNQEYYTAGTTSFRRSRFKQTRQLPEGGGGVRGSITLWTGATDGSMCFESCQFLFDLSDTAAGANVTRAFSCNSNSGNSYIHLVNPSCHDISTQTASNFHAFFDYVSVDAKLFRVYRGIFSFKTAGGAAALCIADGSTSAANHAFVNSAYWQVGTGRYSQNAAIDTQAEWLSGVDTAATFLASAPFLNDPTDLGITTASPLWTVRATSALFPAAQGINGPVTGYIGAYHYGAARPAAGTALPSGRTSGGRVQRVRRR